MRLKKFQSTRPQGARPLDDESKAARFGFNPRARRGRDCRGWIATEAYELVSIHAPAGGATVVLCEYVSGLHVSIHAPAGGATG